MLVISIYKRSQKKRPWKEYWWKGPVPFFREEGCCHDEKGPVPFFGVGFGLVAGWESWLNRYFLPLCGLVGVR